MTTTNLTPSTDDTTKAVLKADARAAAAQTIRDLIHSFVGRDASIEQLQSIATDLRRHTNELDSTETRNQRSGLQGINWNAPPAEGDSITRNDDRPISGRSSPYGLDMQISREGDEVVGHLTLRDGHEGPPGRCHGSIISALFDDIFVFVLNIHSLPAFTGELTIRFEQGVPLNEPLECRVRLDRQEGRKIHMTGELTGDDGAGGHICYSRGRAVFITVDPTILTGDKPSEGTDS